MSFLCEYLQPPRVKRVYASAPCVLLLFSLLFWPESLQSSPGYDIRDRNTQPSRIMPSNGITPTHSNDSLPQADGGAVLIFPIYTSDSATPQAQNTRISLTNTAEATPVFVHLFFVDGATGAAADSYLCLTANQTVSLLASDADPDVNGFLIAVAADAHGCPINFNQLIGEASIKYASGHTAQLVAEAVVSLTENPTSCMASQPTATLRFDGHSYSTLPRVLALSNLMSRADGNDTFMIVDRIGGALIGNLNSSNVFFMVVFDDAENPFSFSFSTLSGPQLRILLKSRPFPRRDFFDQFIPSGRSGWVKLWCLEDVALLGAVFNLNAYNPAFTQGRNLHKLTLTTTASLTIPILPPNC
jgi:hypothetical protein